MIMPFKNIEDKRKCDREWKRNQREQNRLKVIKMLGVNWSKNNAVKYIINYEIRQAGNNHNC